jgi:flavin-dependent dehydrogenase
MFYFGVCPGGYLWIFPKRNRLSVGIARFSPGSVDLRRILVREIAKFGVGLTGVRLHGHPLPLHWRSERLHTTRCLLVGDAAGLVDPLLGEGIRFAVRSAEIAAQAIFKDDLAGYTRRVQQEIGNKQLWAKRIARVLYGFPYLSWRWGLGNPRVGQAMMDVLRERKSYRTFMWQLPLYLLESLVRHPSVRGHS